MMQKLPEHTGPNLILIGYRGTGKTTVARLLAERLGWDWLDADAYLSNKYQRTIREIFAEEGEAGFREKEAAVLAELQGRERLVLATGGGIVLNPDNRKILRQMGNVVWLTAEADVIWQRIQADRATGEQRPALTTHAGLDEVKQMLAVRDPIYRECADLTVDTMGRTPEEISLSIINELELD